MIEQVRDYVKTCLAEGKFDAFVGLKDQDGNIFPHLYERPEDLDAGFTIGDFSGLGDSRYPLARTR